MNSEQQAAEITSGSHGLVYYASSALAWPRVLLGMTSPMLI